MEAQVRTVGECRIDNERLNAIHKNVRKLANRLAEITGSEVVLRSHLEPMLSEEEKDFLAPWWRTRRMAEGMIQYTKVQSIDGILYHKFDAANPKWTRMKMVSERGGNQCELTKVSFLRRGS